MIIAAFILGLVIFGAMMYMALSKKSTFKIRIAALIALGLMILTTIASLILIFTVPVAPTDGLIPLDTELPVKQPRTVGNSLMIFGFILFLVILFVLVLILFLRDQKRRSGHRGV